MSGLKIHFVEMKHHFPQSLQNSNTLTLTTVDDLNFGTIVAVGDASESATLAIAPDGTVGTPATTGTPAYIAIVDSTAAQPAQITIEDGAPGATINVTINNPI